MELKKLIGFSLFFVLTLLSAMSLYARDKTNSFNAQQTTQQNSQQNRQQYIQRIMHKPIYKQATWGLRVVDLTTNQVLIDQNSNQSFFIGSVRKIFSVGELMDAVGPQHRSITTVHRDGEVVNGELKGNLVLIASGDLTMGGRTNPNGSIAITDFDHNYSDALGNSELTKPDPLAGYKQLARRVKKAGINKISGEVIIDDRLFEPFDFRGEFKVSPIFVNDDVVDVIINPGKVNQNALVDWRPHSAAFHVVNHLKTVRANDAYTLELQPVIPDCYGQWYCHGEIKNNLPVNFVPPLTQRYPLIQTFRISKPANYARIVLIEALREAGVKVDHVIVQDNPTKLLKNSAFYNESNAITSLTSLPYSDYAKLVLKVSYNIGADTSLVLFGKTHGVNNMQDSLKIEKDVLQHKYGISPSGFHFVDGSGGAETSATGKTVTDWLQIMFKTPSFKSFYQAFPILAVDGSVAFVKNFESQPALRGAAGHVYVKPGTFLQGHDGVITVKGQALAGYILTKHHHLLAFHLVVNHFDIQSINDLLNIFQDQGEIVANLWSEY